MNKMTAQLLALLDSIDEAAAMEASREKEDRVAAAKPTTTTTTKPTKHTTAHPGVSLALAFANANAHD